MDKKIIDSHTPRLHEQTIDLKISDNFKLLGDDEAVKHLELLSEYLNIMSRKIYESIPSAGGNDTLFQAYILKLSDTVKSLVLKTRIKQKSNVGSSDFNVSIDPTESGFPIFLRDLDFLLRDKEKAGEKLQSIPDNNQLALDAISVIASREIFPTSIIMQKMERNYFETIAKTDFPQMLVFHDATQLKMDDRFVYMKKSTECLDNNSTTPKFFTIYYKITRASYGNSSLNLELESVLEKELNSTTNFALKSLAEKIEEINGVQLMRLERYDIGPFYSKYTKNSDEINKLLEGTNEKFAIIGYRQLAVQRMSEEQRTGLKNFIKFLFSGDIQKGVFSPVVASTVQLIMPHRLIQKAYDLKMEFPFNSGVRMYGINENGDLIE